MSTEYLTIHVLAAGDLFTDVLNAITAFMNQRDFLGLLRITALIGIVMVSAGFLKSRDPTVFAKWFLGYVLCTNIVLLPKTNVLIEDISTQTYHKVDNVPVVFAATASLLTSVGYGLAQSYDALFATLGDFAYTKTGALFGARLIESARDFRIIDPTLKDEMDHYFRSCVVGDIRLNQKYSVGDLAGSDNIWNLITKKPSPLRMTEIGGNLVTCVQASSAEGKNSLKARLDAEIRKTYSIFGINLFGKQKKTDYEKLFETHLTSAARYYQGLTDSSSNIFLQAMMINAMGDGINHYQAFTDSTASVVNHEFTKSQLQHRWSWDILGQKAVWFLPLLHTNLMLILFGVFPLVLALSTMPGGGHIFKGYLQFLLSLQCWPVLFAVINHVMTNVGIDGVSGYGPMTMVNLDKMTELSRDISGVAGYIMAMIPFIAKGLVSNLGEAFNGLATSITGHVQGSGMAVAGEAASASFGLGQTSFYNTTANNFSANKHDSNWSHMHGMHAEQGGSGVIKTITGSGETVFDVSPGMSKGAVSINTSEALNGSLNQAYETSKQTALNESQHFQSAISNAAHRAIQLSTLDGHDMRLGDGVSSQESGQYTQALSKMTSIATDVSKRLGVSQEEAMTTLTSMSAGVHASVSSDRSAIGHLGKWAFGFDGGGRTDEKYDRSSTSGDRYHDNTDNTVTAKEAADFNQSLNYVSHFAQTHHFDDSHSKGASLSNQLGVDLRDAQTASHNVDSSLSTATRVQQARSYVESHGAQINADLNQAFPGYVAATVGTAQRDELFSHPGDMASIQKLQTLGQDFVAHKRDELISEFGNQSQGTKIDALYTQNAHPLIEKERQMGRHYQTNQNALNLNAKTSGVAMNNAAANQFQQSVQGQMEKSRNQTTNDGERLHGGFKETTAEVNQAIQMGKENAKRLPVMPHHNPKKEEH